MPVLDETSIMDLLTMPDNLLRKSLTETERQMATLENHFDGEISEQRLKQMMRDSRYWRDQDPVFVDRVREGFKRLYSREGE